jgi:BirA family biotin operon repressor/biotin-[acetyl-CoA-carboxylase] ligase
MATPYVTIIVDEVSSTQDLAGAELQRSDRPVLIVANRQIAGRGRSGSEWWQAPRGVSASLAFAADALQVTETFSLAVGLAVRSAVATVAAVDLSLKWPNDLEFDDGKVGGILVERDNERTVVGCGLNLWWPEPPAGVSALFDYDPGPDVGAWISEGWAEGLLASQGRWDRDEYKRACSTLGKALTWDPDGLGRAVDVDLDGGLVVSTATGVTTLRSGEVRTLRGA